MRVIILLFLCIGISSCDSTRLFEENTDFEERIWVSAEHPTFVVNVLDHNQLYTIKVNFRNSLEYPKANLYYRFTLTDSLGGMMEEKLMTNFLFDEKTGEPFGSSGLGDIFDHQFPVLENYKFNYSGVYEIQLEQFMRMDTLPGILSAGVRVEKTVGDN